MDGFEQTRVLGWSEWAGLPDLAPGRVLAKVDTGARSCSLHVDSQSLIFRDGIEYVQFELRTGTPGPTHACCLPVADRRVVTNSGGKGSERIFVRTVLKLGDWQREVEVNLVDRHRLRHPMLIGRAAIADAWLVDPAQRFLLGRRATWP